MHVADSWSEVSWKRGGRGFVLLQNCRRGAPEVEYRINKASFIKQYLERSLLANVLLYCRYCVKP
jgi:hypothetical protein